MIISDLRVLPHRLSVFPSPQVKLRLIVAPSHSIHFNIKLLYGNVVSAGGRLIC